MTEQNITLADYGAAGLYEETDRSLFYRKALGLRRFYECCELPKYNGELLYPSGKAYRPDYMSNLFVNLRKLYNDAPETANMIANDFYRYKSSVPPEHTVAGNMWTHSIPNYERILKDGFNSYIKRIEKITDCDMRDGLISLLDGIRSYINRITEYLKEVNAPQRLIDALKKVPFEPAESIYEAVIGWNFILYLDGVDNLGCVASGLYPYYKGEDITALLENLFDNLDINDGYSMALGTDYNPLTLQCLEASKGKRRPMIELFVDEKPLMRYGTRHLRLLEQATDSLLFIIRIFCLAV